MSKVQRVGDLEVNQDLEFQRHIWTVQRVGWVVMTLVVLAALLGLFGPGLFGRATAGNQEAPVSIEEYERFLRFEKPTTLRVHLNLTAGAGGEVRVWLDREYLESVQLQQVTPQPERVEAGSDRLIYVFDVAAEPDQPTAVTFNFQPDKIGPLKGQVGLAEGESLAFRQFVYP